MSDKPKRKRPTGCLSCEKAGRRSKRGENVRIVFDPAIQMPGTPTIDGHRLAAEMIARAMYELGGEEVKHNWQVTHEEIVAACWWAAHWGPRRFKKAWKEWGIEAGGHLWYRCINVPLPPTRAEVEA